ncbi:MAG: ATP-dependent DNA ligase [Nanoarchaeota archaeon]
MKEMLYFGFVELYEKLNSTTKKLEKISILADFLKELGEKGKDEWIYLIKGRVLPEYDVRQFGISRQLTIKAIGSAFGIKDEEIYKRLRKIGDLGEIAEEFAGKKHQSRLFSSKLYVSKVFSNLNKLFSIGGKGSVGKKIALVSEILGSASGKEAKYIVRTLLEDLRVGVADGIIKDAIAEAFFPDEKKEMEELIESAYDLSSDYAVVFSSARKGKSELKKIDIVPGRPMNVMLAVKAEDIDDAFRICGTPLAIEYKYDGFRMLINKDGDKYSLFTRNLEDVTKQFPDVIDVVKKNIHGESFILDSEVVGYDPKSKKYKPFEAVSQRIKRKHDIDKLVRELPVEINVFDVLYYNGKSYLSVLFKERRKLLEKIVKKIHLKIQPAKQIIVSDKKQAEKFYEEALKAGEEGIVVKNLNAHYRHGRKVGYIAKLKPSAKDFDLVIVGAEYGNGKRAGWLTSYIIACKSGEKFLEIGKVSSGLKEKSEEGTTYDEMTKLLKPLITKTGNNYVSVEPKIVVTVIYQNIQKSPSYNSGYALRFPRITTYRPDRKTKDIATLEDVERDVKK